MLLTRFTRPVSPHLTRTPAARSSLLARHRVAPFLPFPVASFARVFSQAREALLLLVIATICTSLNILVRGSHIACFSKLSVIFRPSVIIVSL